jgi:hypothetical protein
MSEDTDVSVPAPEGIAEILVEHEEQLVVLQQTVGGLHQAVEDLLATPPKKKPAPWNWKELNGKESVALMEALREWVDWVNARYGVSDSSRIYGCWYRHGAVVEELTAAWLGWRAANYGHKDPTTDLASWHRDTFWPMLERIASKPWGTSNCHTEHVEPRPSFRDSTDEEFTEFLSELGT